ncbi:MAG: hypothetical protein KY475_25755, partial [Planctomycetes bacterium]|nr:hypothetical protein [Planctomycetota bacterium]
MHIRGYRAVAAAIAILLVATAGWAWVDEWKSGIQWPEPPVVDPGPPGAAPSDAVVLFDGTDLSRFENGEKWEIKDGYAIARESGIPEEQIRAATYA